jgi:phosphatidylglycerophosphate synthase
MSENIDYYNPIDRGLENMADYISPFLKKYNFTPNTITTFSLLTALASLYNLYNRDTTNFAIFLILSYFFDVLDGHYARKYDMVTEFGDKYDHYTDLILIIGLVIVLIKEYKIQEQPILLIIVLFFLVMMIVFMGCYNKEYQNSEVLNSLDEVSPSKETCDKNLNIIKLFSPSTFIIVLIIVVSSMNNCETYGEFINQR